MNRGQGATIVDRKLYKALGFGRSSGIISTLNIGGGGEGGGKPGGSSLGRKSRSERIFGWALGGPKLPTISRGLQEPS